MPVTNCGYPGRRLRDKVQLITHKTRLIRDDDRRQVRPERVHTIARLRGDDVDDGDERRELAREALFNCLERRHNIASRGAVALREHDGVRDAERVEGVEQLLVGPSPYIAEDERVPQYIPGPRAR